MKTKFLVGLLLVASLFAQTVGYPYALGNVTTTALNIKTSAGEVVGYDVYNIGTGNCYIQFFDALAANVTVGTTNPQFAIGAGTLTGHYGTGFRIPFVNAISVAGTTTSTGSSACNADMTGVILYH